MRWIICLISLFSFGPASAQTWSERWDRIYDAEDDNFEVGRAITTTPDGNVVVTGSARTVYNKSEIHTAKYDGSTGNILWEIDSQPEAFFSDGASSLDVDASGDIIVAGSRTGFTSSDAGFYLVKYSGVDGSKLWDRHFGTRSQVTDVTFDEVGNVVATGWTRVDGFSPISGNIHTFKFDGENGETIWENTFDSDHFDSRSNDQSRSVAMGPDGNVFVTGHAASGANIGAVTLKIDGASGILQWHMIRLAAGTIGEAGEDIVVDSAGNPIIVTSSDRGFAGFRVVEYRGSDGQQQWINTLNRANVDFPRDLAIDSSNNLFVTGWTVSSETGEDIVTRKINGGSGNTIWTKDYNGNEEVGFSKDDLGFAVAIDLNGDAVVAGITDVTGRGDEPIFLRYSSANGTLLDSWVWELTTRDDVSRSRHDLAVGPGLICMTGQASFLSANDAFVLALRNPNGALISTTSLADTGSSTASFHVLIDPNGSATTVAFEYGPVDEGFTSTIQAGSIGSGTSFQEAAAEASSLLPGTLYQVRAVASNPTGTSYGQVIQFTTSVSISIEDWRLLHFESDAGSDLAQDGSDPDLDGIINLLEYAFWLDPLKPSAGELPEPTVVGDFLVIEFFEPPSVEGIVYGARTTDDLSSGEWTPVPNSSEAPHHLYRLPIDTSRGFMRLDVSHAAP